MSIQNAVHTAIKIFFIINNKMELLQSQAPVDQELSGSSASAIHGTFDIGHGTYEFGNIEEKLFSEGTK